MLEEGNNNRFVPVQDGRHTCHEPEDTSMDTNALRRLCVATVLCLTFMIGEIIGGYFAHSLAILSDAAHMLTDLISFFISILSIWLAKRPVSSSLSYGWYRSEVIGAMTSIILIWIVTGVLVYSGIMRIINKDYEVHGLPMIITAGAGVLVNIVMGLVLGSHGHSHGGGSGHSHGGSSGHNHGHSHNGSAGHNHSHGTNDDEGPKKRENLNVRAAFIHVVGDLLQSIGVLIAAIVIYFKREYSIIDPICTFIFSVLVMFTTFNIARETLRILMEGTPKGYPVNEVHKLIASIQGVRQVHSLRIWSLNVNKINLTAHVAIKDGLDCQEMLQLIQKELKTKWTFHDATVQVETYTNDMNECVRCNYLTKKLNPLEATWSNATNHSGDNPQNIISEP